MTERIFIPGAQWLYFKIYTGQKSADDILMYVVYPYVSSLINEGLISRYFFIRYSDPDFHIRLRLFIEDPQNYTEVFLRFYDAFNPYVINELVSKISCDTYKREIERYGECTIELLEEIFYIDSKYSILLLEYLSRLPMADREILRWKLSILLLNDTMTAFDYTIQKKAEITDLLAKNFKQEFGFTTHAYTKQLNDKYRAVSNDIATILRREGIEEYLDLLNTRRQQIEVLAQKILAIETSEESDVVVLDLLGSIQHMTMNRWFRAKNRLHEAVIYDFLSRYFTSTVARSKNTKQEVPENLRE